ncbi:MAG: hypothetical protein WCR53_06070 [Bacteroidaceae bacterium]|jgi:hypothetical protein
MLRLYSLLLKLHFIGQHFNQEETVYLVGIFKTLDTFLYLVEILSGYRVLNEKLLLIVCDAVRFFCDATRFFHDALRFFCDALRHQL